MPIQRTQAVVTGRRPLGESDRLVEFYTRDFGKMRGVAKSARRPRSRFGSALELLTLGDLVFFESPRSDLARIDHFDILEPFMAVREHLERLGHGAWAIECVTRLSAERDPHPALFRLVVRDLRALERSRRPGWVSTCFGLRAVDLLGQRPRLDACVSCGRPFPFPDVRIDVAAGGVVCAGCAGAADAMAVSGAAVGALKRLREVRWDDGLRLALTEPLERELGAITHGLVARLMGQHPRSSRYLGQLRQSVTRVAEGSAPQFG